MTLAPTTDDILGLLLDCGKEGLATALVTLTGIAGTSSRAVGAQMAISADGRYLGSFSGGCIEAAIVSEAQKAIEAGEMSVVRFGAGSPYLDIRLPCGGGIDLLFTPNPDPDVITDLRKQLKTRRACALTLGPSGIGMAEPVAQSGWAGDVFTLHYVPPLKVVAIGQGDDLEAVVRLAHLFGARAEAFSPAARDVEALRAAGIDATLLSSRTAIADVTSDPWTAFIFVFHDHDWEETLIPPALGQPHFYIGAVGSRRTHAARLDMLRASGTDQSLIEKLRPRVGLIPSTRDPATLALSLMSDIVQEYGKLTSA